MNISSLPSDLQELLEKSGISQLNEPQQLAVKNGLFEGKNILVASPTASGKTFVAELAFLKNFASRGKTVYLVPLKALASEKYSEFQEKYGTFMRIAISIGDTDSSDDWLERYDLIIASNEKMDSLIRHDAKWLKEITLVICDEIHLLNDASRGPTLEVVLTQLRSVQRQVIALSATVNNAEEIAQWLGAELVKSSYRPVKLVRGIYYPGVIEFEDKKRIEMPGKQDAEVLLAVDTLKNRKQALVFVSTRRSAEAAAEKIGLSLTAKLSSEEKLQLKALSLQIKKALSSPTKQCVRLATCVENGTAFHHAGLVAKQRKIIEDAFRSGTIKFITATPTLSFGMNLPAWRVVVRDVKRYGTYGSDYIPVMEVHQMFGRSGRPRYDTEGQAILVAKSASEAVTLRERYINGEPEPVYSKLSSEPALRFHTLALIASGLEGTKSLRNFFSRTFFAHQYGDMEKVMESVFRIVHDLKMWGFVSMEKKKFISDDFVPAFSLDEDQKITVTPLGKRVAELYLDPLSAHTIISNLGKSGIMNHLITICNCGEMAPLVRPKRDEYESLEQSVVDNKISDVPDVWDYEYEKFMASVKTSLMFMDWTSEIGEDKILNSYNVAPGELYAKTHNAEWVLFAASEIARLLENRAASSNFRRLSLMVKHGVREELLKLIEVRGIGRVRARLLYKNGIKSRSDIINAPETMLAKILGSQKLAEQMKKDTVSHLDAKMRRVKSMKSKDEYNAGESG